jgi:hypothetical protein
MRFSVLAAASIMNLLRKQRDSASGLSIFDDSTQVHTPCRAAKPNYHLMLSYLERLIQHPSSINQHQQLRLSIKLLTVFISDPW